MSNTALILQIMQADQWHDIGEIVTMSNLNKDSVSSILKLLVRNGLVDIDSTNRYKRDKKYKSKQRELFRR